MTIGASRERSSAKEPIPPGFHQFGEFLLERLRASPALPTNRGYLAADFAEISDSGVEFLSSQAMAGREAREGDIQLFDVPICPWD
jgi:hypothetical protein